MTSSKGKLQRNPDEKDGDIIYSKPRFWLRKEKDNTSREWHMAKQVQSDLVDFAWEILAKEEDKEVVREWHMSKQNDTRKHLTLIVKS